MSYILEALKKSSEERARLVAAAPRTEPALANARHATRWSPWWLIAAMLLGALAVTTFIRSGTDQPEAKPDRPPKHLPMAADSTTNSATDSATNSTTDSTTVPAPVRLDDVPAPVRLDDVPATATASVKKPLQKNPDAESPPRMAQVDAPSPPPKKPAAKPAPSPPEMPTIAAVEAPVRQAAPNGRSEMPPELLKQVLAIPISAHIYSSKPTERMVIIDGRGVREGDSLPSGVLVEQITPTGIAVSYKGYRASKPVN